VSFTYEPSTPVGSVRLLIGDTDIEATIDVRLEDEDIKRLIELTCGTSSPGASGLRRAAAQAADVLAAKFARKAEGSTGPNRLAPSSRAQELRATASRLRMESSMGAAPYAGGISVSDKAARAADEDRVQPAFSAGMLDHPGA